MSSTKLKSQNKRKKANHLAHETSPYLLQHAYNPVDWYPWAAEALEKAKVEDKPILLSIGYSACHWCHVMAHESFEDNDVAQLMNQHFVPIKVDREERPDLDEIYMKAVQLMTGQGGWPMTVFLTPDMKPFFGGTYFPLEDRHGMPSFKRLLNVIAEAWQSQRTNLLSSSEELLKHLTAMNEIETTGVALNFSIIENSMDRMIQHFDTRWGGFGGAPKFPQAYSLELSMRLASQKSPCPKALRAECLDVVTTSLDRMSYGGIHDQLGGGFARYSVDRQWRIPHFEKMLYDNASLSRAYLYGYLLTGRKYWGKIAQATIDFVIRELKATNGAFFSSLDADSEGQEGKFYVWEQEEVLDCLGKEDGTWFSEVFSLRPEGNFEHGNNVLYLAQPPEDLAQKYKLTEDEFWQRLTPLKNKLLERRETRIRPGCDQKVLTSWNALMVSSLIDGYRILKDERYLKTAQETAHFILDALSRNGRLLRTWAQGKAKLNGYLDDYAYFAQALLDLASVEPNSIWLKEAVRITDLLLEHFWDKENPGFYYTSDDHEALLTRSKSFYDGSTPSGTSAALFTLMRIAKITGIGEYQNKAQAVFQNLAPNCPRSPDQFANLLCALDFHLAGGSEIVLTTNGSNLDWQELIYTISSFYLPNTVLALMPGSESAKIESAPSWLKQSPLFEGKDVVSDRPTVYICHNYVCQQPITDKSLLASKLKELSCEM